MSHDGHTRKDQVQGNERPLKKSAEDGLFGRRDVLQLGAAGVLSSLVSLPVSAAPEKKDDRGTLNKRWNSLVSKHGSFEVLEYRRSSTEVITNPEGGVDCSELIEFNDGHRIQKRISHIGHGEFSVGLGDENYKLKIDSEDQELLRRKLYFVGEKLREDSRLKAEARERKRSTGGD